MNWKNYFLKLSFLLFILTGIIIILGSILNLVYNSWSVRMTVAINALIFFVTFIINTYNNKKAKYKKIVIILSVIMIFILTVYLMILFTMKGQM